MVASRRVEELYRLAAFSRRKSLLVMALGACRTFGSVLACLQRSPYFCYELLDVDSKSKVSVERTEKEEVGDQPEAQG